MAEAERYKVLIVEDEQEARELVADISEEGRRVITNAARICRERNPERLACQCFPCQLFRWM
jgi:CheY-like chemotaxis protein